MRTLTYNKSLSSFVWNSSFEDRHVARINGFKFSDTEKIWYTKSHGIAARLREYADDSAKVHLSKVLLTNSPWTKPIPCPKNLKPYDFQLTAVRWALERNRSYLGLDAGLGKTICAALTLNALDTAMCVYICPPFLKLNVGKEFDIWKHTKTSWKSRIVSDTLLQREETTEEIKSFVEAFKSTAILIVDEAHRFNNLKSKRAKALYSKVIPLFDRIIFMSGTPMRKRPMELYAPLSHLAPETIGFMNRFEYGRKYCAAYKGPFGWNFDGSSNMKELGARIKINFMLRLRQKDVLAELPEVREELVFIGEDLPYQLSKLERQILKDKSPEDLMKSTLGDLHIATYRKELGLLKAKSSIEYLKFLLTETNESILVFAIHKSVIASLEKELFEFYPLVITGDTKPESRQGIAEKFQTSKKHRLMLLNITAGGIGLNLFKASKVIFVEYSWVVGENEQAFKRAHRIGQTSKVIVQYLVFRNSIDRPVMEVNLNNRRTINNV